MVSSLCWEHASEMWYQQKLCRKKRFYHSSFTVPNSLLRIQITPGSTGILLRKLKLSVRLGRSKAVVIGDGSSSYLIDLTKLNRNDKSN